jgi:hypothetical protein
MKDANRVRAWVVFSLCWVFGIGWGVLIPFAIALGSGHADRQGLFVLQLWIELPLAGVASGLYRLRRWGAAALGLFFVAVLGYCWQLGVVQEGLLFLALWLAPWSVVTGLLWKNRSELRPGW